MSTVSAVAQGYQASMIGPPKTFVSENGAYRVTLETIDPQNLRKLIGPPEIELTMAEINSPASNPIWTIKFRGMMLNVANLGGVVANDGNYFAELSATKIAFYTKS